ncbi:MAG: sigma-54-dependent Fis family transcriptional regulator [Proteobacteria bacterium]|nr:sigma-54-dependent Fis family transcriptional regulator [Pseudomonadota bacterium]MBS0462538.1 sigma-54-dependent Fis family transcriptional regulator [Pseudomonadota bacterium]
MSKPTVLVVDDERDIRELLTITLGRMGLLVDSAGTVAEARARLAGARYGLCLTDMRLPDGNGLEIVAHIVARHPETPVAMITAYGNVEAAVDALKAGAFDFVSKPVDLSVLRRLVNNALELQQRRAAAAPTSSGLIGQAPVMQQLRQTIGKLARSQAPVYIAGESGAGKERVARLIHEQGPRASGPFVPVNCGAIPTELMESEFFGHKKGSFTGAHADKEGLFQAAHGGTLFLDEVAELPLSMQVKLLRAIQEKSVRPVGAPTEIPVDVRILSATHKDLARQVEDNRFRHDLFYRLNVIELRVPPLRERVEDIPLLADAILRRLSSEIGEPMPVLSADALVVLRDYPFPGNVRELENILERATALCEGETIQPPDLRLPAGTGPRGASAAVSASAGNGPTGASPSPTGSGDDLPRHLENLEREAIVRALEECRYNKTKAAAKLGITFRALRYKLKKLAIE